MFPPSLYDYITKDLKKDMILVLNKIDLAPAPLVAAWKNYFKEKYPALHIVMFTTLPGYNLVGKQEDKAGKHLQFNIKYWNKFVEFTLYKISNTSILF